MDTVPGLPFQNEMPHGFPSPHQHQGATTCLSHPAYAVPHDLLFSF